MKHKVNTHREGCQNYKGQSLTIALVGLEPAMQNRLVLNPESKLLLSASAGVTGRKTMSGSSFNHDVIYLHGANAKFQTQKATRKGQKRYTTEPQ